MEVNMKVTEYVKGTLLSLSKFEIALWLVSTVTVTVAFFLGNERDGFVLAATLVGAAALIFTAKGNVIGQLLWIVFAGLYTVVSLKQAYYGEVITYVFMTGGIALLSTIEWIKHPYSRGTVKVGHPSKRAFILVGILTAAVTVILYFVLRWLGTASLLISTFSVATSFAASSLTLLRSPYYAIAYTLNDIVLIILWSIAAISDASAIPMIISFSVFLVNDIYGFVNWLRLERKQRS